MRGDELADEERLDGDEPDDELTGDEPVLAEHEEPRA